MCKHIKDPQSLIFAMLKLTTSQTLNVLTLLDSGISGVQISHQTGLSTATISRLCSQHRPDLPRSSGGRPSKLTPANISYAARLICTGRVENAVEATKSLSDITNSTISSQTLRRQLRKRGLKAVVKKKRPLLKPHHKKARREFAERHKEWTVEDWKRVWWSDETKINRLGSDGRKYVWKQVGEPLNDRLVEGTTKFGGGNLMMWGCMGWDGVGYACKIDGRMDGELYTQILEEDFQATLEYYGQEMEDIIFQQDNDPKHTCKKAKEWFKDSGLEVLKWPAQSPDLNPIEHLWTYLKKQLQKYEEPPNSVHQLWDRVQAEWEKIPKEECQKLIESMPRRVAAVAKAKGGYTKY